MGNSRQLRQNTAQHKPKNSRSKGDDKKVAQATQKVIDYLNQRLSLGEMGYYLEYITSIKLSEMIEIIRSYEQRFDFANPAKETSYMKPDGGILMLRSKKDKQFKRVVLVVEMKRQGTNDQRLQEGKAKQAQGNAIERLGKNLIGIRATLRYENITPFICFGWGIDFAEDSSINDRVIVMNEFYPLNKIFVFKREGFSPVSMFFRTQEWTIDELFSIMKEVAETSIRYYIF